MKELWQLIKMLFSSKPGDFDTPKLLPMSIILSRDTVS